jgi:hypothetical protein
MATTPEIVSALKDVTVACAAALTAWAAVIGLSKWRRELKGKTEFDLAFDLAKVTYGLRDELRACRSPLVSGSEFPPGSDMLASSQDPQVWVYVFQNRWKSVTNVLPDFDSRALAAEALWGSAVRSKTDELRKCVWELYASMQSFIENKAAEGEDLRADPAFGKEIRKAVFSSGSKDNPLDQRIECAIQGIEDQIRHHLRRD